MAKNVIKSDLVIQHGCVLPFCKKIESHAKHFCKQNIKLERQLFLCIKKYNK